MKAKKDIKPFDLHVGQQIKQAREKAGYTQDGFSELIGMGSKNVSAIERGLVGVSLSMIKNICCKLCISSDSLIMTEQSLIGADDLSIVGERLKRLSPQQFDLVLSVINKMFEAFALNEKGEGC